MSEIFSGMGFPLVSGRKISATRAASEKDPKMKRAELEITYKLENYH